MEGRGGKRGKGRDGKEGKEGDGKRGKGQGREAPSYYFIIRPLLQSHMHAVLRYFSFDGVLADSRPISDMTLELALVREGVLSFADSHFSAADARCYPTSYRSEELGCLYQNLFVCVWLCGFVCVCVFVCQTR